MEENHFVRRLHMTRTQIWRQIKHHREMMITKQVIITALTENIQLEQLSTCVSAMTEASSLYPLHVEAPKMPPNPMRGFAAANSTSSWCWVNIQLESMPLLAHFCLWQRSQNNHISIVSRSRHDLSGEKGSLIGRNHAGWMDEDSMAGWVGWCVLCLWFTRTTYFRHLHRVGTFWISHDCPRAKKHFMLSLLLNYLERKFVNATIC